MEVNHLIFQRMEDNHDDHSPLFNGINVYGYKGFYAFYFLQLDDSFF